MRLTRARSKRHTAHDIARRIARFNGRVFLANVLLMGLTGTVQAYAVEERKATLVLVTNHRDAAIIPLLRSELESLGLVVETVDKGADEVIPRDLKLAAHDRKAVAAVRVLVSSGVVEVWIADRVTGKVVLREVMAEDAESKISESTVVLRVVELLRASLMEVDAPHPARGELAPPPKLYDVVGFPDEAGRLRLELGPSVIVSAGGVGPSLAAQFEVGYRLLSQLTVRGFGAMSMLAGRIKAVEGSASVNTRLVGLGIELHTRVSESRWQAFARLGVGLLSLDSRGQTSAPYVGYERNDTGLAFLLGVGTRFRLTRNLAVSAALEGARALHPVAMQFNDKTVARFGTGVALGSLGIVVAVP